MSEEVIVKYCSPTLAGLKTGSMFSCVYEKQWCAGKPLTKLAVAS